MEINRSGSLKQRLRRLSRQQHDDVHIDQTSLGEMSSRSNQDEPPKPDHRGRSPRAMHSSTLSLADSEVSNQHNSAINAPSIVLQPSSDNATQEANSFKTADEPMISQDINDDHFHEPENEPVGGLAGSLFSSMMNAASSFVGTTKHSRPHEIQQDPSIIKSSTKLNNSSIVGLGVHRAGIATLAAEPHSITLKDLGVDQEDKNSSSQARLLDIEDPEFERSRKTNKGNARSTSVMTGQSRRRRDSMAISLQNDSTQQKPVTGFAVATNKRNREFHATFRSVPDVDYLLDDYGCALQKEILVHGRMYVSESHVCFNSNIFGWVTNLVIAFSDIRAIEKRSTAGIFPNAIQISTAQAKHIFASFIARDTTYELIVNVWRLAHPLIQSTIHGVEIADPGEDSFSDNTTNSDEEDLDSLTNSIFDNDDDIEEDEHELARDSPRLNATKQELDDTTRSASLTFPGPQQHAPTQAPSLQDGSALAKNLVDEVLEAPLGRVHELLFGDDVSFMREFLITKEKLLDVQVPQFGATNGNDTRTITYVKPLSGPIGPKQTRCICEDIYEMRDFENSVQVMQTTTTPDVPSGDAFVIKTRFNLMWAENNKTRFVAHCAIEWSKSSWIKGAIEKGASSGQQQFMTDLVDAIRSQLTDGTKKKRGKGKRGKSDPQELTPVENESKNTNSDTVSNVSEAVLAVARQVNLNVIILVLLLGMMIAIVRIQHDVRMQSSRPIGRNSDSPARWPIAESQLWAWLKERSDALPADHSSQPLQAIKSPAELAEAIKHTKKQLQLLESAAIVAARDPQVAR